MIGWLKGQIIDKDEPGKLVIDVNGVGYDVETSLSSFFQIENLSGAVGLHIHTVVREDAFLLYGFVDKKERQLFRALIKVNGIGPKSAIAILSSITPKDFVNSIEAGDISLLTRLPGIGKKTAERLVIEMRDSVKTLSLSGESVLQTRKGQRLEQDEAISALVALGYKQHDAAKIVSKLDDGEKSCEQLIRQALQVVAGV